MWATQYHRISLSSVGESHPYIFISLSVWPIYFFFFPVIPCGTYVLLSYIMLSQIWSISYYTCNNTASGNDFWGNKRDKSQQRLCLWWHGCHITLPAVSRKIKCLYYNFQWWSLMPIKIKAILGCLELWKWLTCDQAVLLPPWFGG